MADSPISRSYLFTLEEKFRPGCGQEYVDYTKKLIELIRQLDLGLAFSAFGTDDGYMDYNQRVASQCDYGPKLEAWGKVQEEALATEWGRKRQSIIEWSRYSLWERLADLSHVPAHPDPDPSRLTHFFWKNIRVRPERENELVETARQIRALAARNNVERGYNVFRNVIGYEGPFYSVIVSGQDAEEVRRWLQDTGRRFAFDLWPYLPTLTASVETTTDFRGKTVPELCLAQR